MFMENLVFIVNLCFLHLLSAFLQFLVIVQVFHFARQELEW